MPYTMTVQPTPNPNALKFVVNERIIKKGNITFKSQDEAQDVPLAQALFDLPHVQEVFFNENYVTVTQDGQIDWDALENSIQAVILENLPGHNPAIALKAGPRTAPSAENTDPKRQKLEELLDQNIRPYLQMDGGDVQVVNFTGNVVTISYRGACGGCPGAAFGTLRAIENVLREQFDPNIVVQLDRGGCAH